MKKLFSIFICLTLCTYAFAQQSTDKNNAQTQSGKRKERNQKPPACYIGIGLGMNHPSGVFGFDFNIPVSNYVTIDAGAGTSTWGNKLFAEVKYYLKPMQRGWAFGGGLTFSSGQDNFKARLETQYYGRQRVTLALKPQANIFAGIYHYWTLGRSHSRFYVDLGWSVPLHEAQFDRKYGPALSTNGVRSVKFISPGGLMGGLGFSFALHRHSN